MSDEKTSLADQIRDNPCDCCGQPIHPAQIEYHFLLDSGDVFRLHIGCLGMWLAELRRRGLVKQNGTL
jgi:hypothetical protein